MHYSLSLSPPLEEPDGEALPGLHALEALAAAHVVEDLFGMVGTCNKQKFSFIQIQSRLCTPLQKVLEVGFQIPAEFPLWHDVLMQMLSENAKTNKIYGGVQF